MASVSRSGSQRSTYMYADGISATSGMKALEFQLRHPLLEVHEGNVSKFDDGKRLDPKVSLYLLREVMLEMHKFGLCYSATTKTKSAGAQELHYRPIACAMLPVLARLAPRAHELLDGEDPRHLRTKEVVVGFEQSSAGMQIDSGEGEDLSSSFMSDGSDLCGFSFQGGLFIHEDGTQIKGREAVDVRGVVHDVETGIEVGRSLLEMKGLNLDWPTHVFQNLHNGMGMVDFNVTYKRYKKFHVVVYGKGWLGCAEIDPVGYLVLEKDKPLTIDACAKFKQHVHEKCKYLKRKRSQKARAQILKLEKDYINKSDEQLLSYFTQKLKSGMERTAHVLNISSSGIFYMPCFKDHVSLIVGEATYRENVFRTLTFPLLEDSQSTGDQIVLEALARIIYGDRVLQWKLPSLLQHVMKRQQEEVERVDLVMAKCGWT